jgi:phage tail sheath protein FI
MIYKTPGVYIKEISTFPPSVVPVETAIPAFVGYTEKAVDADGNSLTMQPTRIESLLDFETYFGGEYRPASYRVELNTTTGAIGTITPLNDAGTARRYYLYGCLRHFYANGGGSCYIVSVGSYTTDPSNSTLSDGLATLEQVDEPTLLLFPDGVSLDSLDLDTDDNPVLLGGLQQNALGQCANLQDRFVIMDLQGGHPSYIGDADPIGSFRNAIGTNNLKYGAAYYPWLQTIYRPEVHFRHLNFVAPAVPPLVGSAISSSTLDTLLTDPNTEEFNALVPATRSADSTVQTVISAVNINAMAGTDPLTLNRDNFAALTSHFAGLLGLLRQLPGLPDSPTPEQIEDAVQQRFGNLLLLARALALALPSLAGNSSLPADIGQTLTNLQGDTTLHNAIRTLIALEKDPGVLDAAVEERTAENVDSAYAALDNTDWITPPNDEAGDPIGEPLVNTINASDTPIPGAEADLRQFALNAAAAIQTPFETLAEALLALFETAEFLANEAETQLFTNHPVMKAAVEQVQKTMSILPCSGAVAGIYATVDRTRGVWKAPANISVNDVVGPTVKINDAVQSDLNVHFTGKSINAIRAFTGKGTLVWGARTLAGNDNEWRYVPVRRFFNMAEESIKKATEPFVFEPNDANTWVRVRAMIENFLTLQWRAGALAGAKTEQAFYVKVGLGETMTAQDILEGRMNVEIGMAVVRPAEFIILKFAHKMQVS